MSRDFGGTAPALAQARLYAILDTGYVPDVAIEPVCRALLEGGADVIQLRAKGEDARQRRRLLERILPLFPPAGGTPLILNDDVELARQYPGVGAHVGQDDLSPVEARRLLGPGPLLGLSTHSLEQARAALALGPDVLSYFAVGPLFATPTKPDYPPVGLELPAAVRRLNPSLPFFCIGGINRRTIDAVAGSGVRRAVVVSDVLCSPDPAAVIRHLKEKLPALSS